MPSLPSGIRAAKREEVRPALCSFFCFFFLLCGYYVLRPIRDRMANEAGVKELPWMFTAVFVAMLAIAPVYSALVARFPRRKFLPWIYGFFAVNLAIFWLLLSPGGGPLPIVKAFFVWISIFSLFQVSVFWSFMADVFTLEQGERLFGFVAAGGSSGALTGSLATALLADPLGTRNLLAVPILCLCMAILSILFVNRAALGMPRPARSGAEAFRPDEKIGGGALTGIAVIFRSGYLIGISSYFFLVSACSTFAYFLQTRIVSEAVPIRDQQTALFAKIETLVNILAFVLQTAVTREVLTRLGLALALSIAPAVFLLGFPALAAMPELTVLVTLQVAARSVNYGITQPSGAVLYTFVSREEKYKSKNFIDTVVQRGGDTATIWLIESLGLGLVQVPLQGIAFALLWLAVGCLVARAAARRAPGS